MSSNANDQTKIKVDMKAIIKHFKIDENEQFNEQFENWFTKELLPKLNAQYAYMLSRELIIILQLQMQIQNEASTAATLQELGLQNNKGKAKQNAVNDDSKSSSDSTGDPLTSHKEHTSTSNG